MTVTKRLLLAGFLSLLGRNAVGADMSAHMPSRQPSAGEHQAISRQIAGAWQHLSSLAATWRQRASDRHTLHGMRNAQFQDLGLKCRDENASYHRYL